MCIIENNKRVTDRFWCTVFGLLLQIVFLVHVPYFIQKHQPVAFISIDTTSQESNLWQEETVDYLKDRVSAPSSVFKKVAFWRPSIIRVATKKFWSQKKINNNNNNNCNIQGRTLVYVT